MTGIGTFLLFGAVTASLAGASLVWRGTALDRMWTLNPRAYRELAPFGKLAGILFLLLGMTLAFTGMGWFKRRLWGWALAVAVIATQVLGGAVGWDRRRNCRCAAILCVARGREERLSARRTAHIKC